MKTYYLSISTALAGVIMATGASAQCVTTQDCKALGYTETSCSGKGVRCPFGSGWFCADDPAQDCEDSGFKYTCTGSNQTGGVGGACAGNGKYASCTCADKYKWSGTACVSCGSSYKYKCTGTGYAGGSGTGCGNYYTACSCSSGYEWKSGSCQKETPTEGIVGDQYYCDGKVVGVRASGMGFFVAIENATYNGSQTMNWNNANSQAARAFCGKGRLPTKDELLTIYSNKSKINSLSTAAGGQNLTNGWYWSSTNYGNGGHYYVDMSYGSVDQCGLLLGRLRQQLCSPGARFLGFYPFIPLIFSSASAELKIFLRGI